VSVTKGVKLLGLPLSLLGGLALFFFLAFLERILATGFLGNAVIEEAAKLSLFPITLALVHILGVPEQQDVYLYPLLIVLGFGISENMAYFIRFPTGVVFIRLLYAYPIHVNTALLYTLLFVQRKHLSALMVLVPAVLYHYVLNLLSLSISSKAVQILIGLVNTALLIYLVYRLLQIVLTRSFVYVRQKP